MPRDSSSAFRQIPQYFCYSALWLVQAEVTVAPQGPTVTQRISQAGETCYTRLVKYLHVCEINMLLSHKRLSLIVYFFKNIYLLLELAVHIET